MEAIIMRGKDRDEITIEADSDMIIVKVMPDEARRMLLNCSEGRYWDEPMDEFLRAIEKACKELDEG